MTTDNAVLAGRLRTRNAALGLFAVLLFIGSLWATWIFLRGGFEPGMPVNAVFSSRGVGQQLPTGGDVKVRGVLVGRIQDVNLSHEGNAIVEMRIDEGYKFPAESSLEIRSKTVFGQKWIELIPPPVDTGAYLEAGSTIPDERTTEPLEFELALQLGHDLLSEIPLRDLSRIFRALSQGFSGQEADARRSLDKGLIALRAVNARSDDLDLSLRQLAEFSEWLNQNDDALLHFMSSVDSANRALVGAAPEFSSSLTTVPAALNRVAQFQETTEPDFARLVENGATLAEIVAARADNLTDIIVQLEAFNTVWNSGLSQPCGGVYERNMTCWQVYQLPGLNSRGTYGRTTPANDEPGDPGLVSNRTASPMTQAGFQTLLEDYGSGRLSPNLAHILFWESSSAWSGGAR